MTHSNIRLSLRRPWALAALATLLAGCAQLGGTGTAGSVGTSASTGGREVELRSGQCPPPAYPDAAFQARATGVTVVTFTVDANGAVTSTSVSRSSGGTKEHQMLDNAAMALVRQCKFPAMPGKPPGTAAIEYNWALK